MSKVYLGLGANLNQPIQQIRNAVSALGQIDEICITAKSSLFGSKPMGPQDQPDYVNAVIEIETSLLPIALLDITQKIELELGRVRKDERWGPRTLDIDILLFANQLINLPRLQVPHYGIKVREFVLYPLQQIKPDLIFPDGCKLSEIILNIDKNGLTLLSPL